MNFPQPVQNMQIPEAVTNLGNNLSTAVDQAKSGFNETVSGFGSQVEAGASASQGFLQSNTIIAKFAFILMIVIAFIILFILGINLLQYFLSPPTAPYVVYGMIDGTNSKIIPTDPSKMGSVSIKHSNNKTTGLEFTWSFWLQVTDIGGKNTYQHVFNKGDTTWITTPPLDGIASVNNGPGVYISKTSSTPDNISGNLRIIMDTVASNSSSGNDSNIINIPNIPMGSSSNPKWFHVAIRMQNTIMDVYVNGIVSKRLILPQVPKQNYNDINVCQNGGFNGKLSNLQYFPYALNAFDINRIVYNGPNTNQSGLNASATNSNNSAYLSSKWYSR